MDEEDLDMHLDKEAERQWKAFLSSSKVRFDRLHHAAVMGLPCVPSLVSWSVRLSSHVMMACLFFIFADNGGT